MQPFVLPDPFPTTVNGYGNLLADYIEHRGHCQTGGYFAGTPTTQFARQRLQPPACLVGAHWMIESIAGVARQDFVRRLWRHTKASLEVRVGTHNVAEWSDTTKTKKVIKTLRSLEAA